MYYRLRDIPALVRTPLGRMQLVSGTYGFRAWPLLSRLAIVHRRTLARKTRVVAVVGSFGKTTTARAVSVSLGREPHPRVGFNFLGFLADAVLRIRPRDRHAVIEVGIAGPGERPLE